MYADGRGIPRDRAEALKWWRAAAEHGDTPAQYNLGVAYDYGQGLPKNQGEAAKLYRLAADKGHVLAQVNLGLLYDQGQGVPQDYVLAYMWFNLAGSYGAQLGNKHRDALVPRMTPGQIAEAQKLSREWKPVTPGAAQAQ
jgi:TPR repeat protein